MPANETGLTLPDLEAVYDTLAETLDQAAPHQREKLLVKLVLLQAQDQADRQRFGELAAIALQDL